MGNSNVHPDLSETSSQNEFALPPFTIDRNICEFIRIGVNKDGSGIKYKKNVINKFQRERLSAEYVKNFIGKLETKIPRYDCIENLVEELHKENPQKFKELIDFEVGLKELKETSDKLKFVLQGREALPSGVFLLQAKESIKLKRAEKLAKKSLCIIS